MKNFDKASVARFVGLIIVIANAVLNLIGFETIPSELGEYITSAFLIIVGLMAAWKNNYLSKKGQLQKKALQAQGLIKK